MEEFGDNEAREEGTRGIRAEWIVVLSRVYDCGVNVMCGKGEEWEGGGKEKEKGNGKGKGRR